MRLSTAASLLAAKASAKLTELCGPGGGPHGCWKAGVLAVGAEAVGMGPTHPIAAVDICCAGARGTGLYATGMVDHGVEVTVPADVGAYPACG